MTDNTDIAEQVEKYLLRIARASYLDGCSREEFLTYVASHRPDGYPVNKATRILEEAARCFDIVVGTAGVGPIP